MQTPSSDPLNAFEKTVLQLNVRELLDDPQLLTSITLRSLTSETLNQETGVVTPVYDTDTMNALRRVVTANEVAQAGGKLELKDLVYLVDQADLTKVTVQIVDSIVEGTDVLGVIMYAGDPLGFTWQIFARLE